jgi:hypothetical protein
MTPTARKRACRAEPIGSYAGRAIFSARRGLETERCPYCGVPVKKANLKGHFEKVHPKPGSSISKAQGPQAQVKATSFVKHHRNRNIAILALILIAVVGVSVVFAQLSSSATMRMHIHPVLAITLNGSPYTVPANIGIDPSLWIDHSLDKYGLEGLAPLHTHDASGTIHVESNTVRDFTLHEFLAIWGQPRDGSQIAGVQVVSLTVDGVQQPSPSQDVVLKDGQHIAIVAGGSQ